MDFETDDPDYEMLWHLAHLIADHDISPSRLGSGNVHAAKFLVMVSMNGRCMSQGNLSLT